MKEVFIHYGVGGGVNFIKGWAFIMDGGGLLLY